MEHNLPERFSGAKIFSSEVSDGQMNFLSRDGPKNVKKFLAKIGAKKPYCSAGQPHKIEIDNISKPGRYLKADGLITEKDFTLGVKTADCIPLLIYDPVSGLIGAVHVARHNLLSGIISKSLAREFHKIVLKSSPCLAFLGPHIRVNHYELKNDALKPLRHSRWEKFLRNRRKIYFDLTKAIISELEVLGFNKDNIIDCGIDTFSSKKFFSSRRERQQKGVGTFVTVIFKNGDQD